jgi:FkbM family methyltransferase
MFERTTTGSGTMVRNWQSIKRTDIYQRLKASWVYDAYWRVANKRYIEDRRLELNFYRAVLIGLQRGGLIFDIGANRGYKTGMFLRLGARVVSVEPDEASQTLLEQQFINYRLRKPAMVIVPKAVSDKSAVEKMWIDAPGSALNTLSDKWAETLRHDGDRFGEGLEFAKFKEIETVSIDDLVAEHGLPFYIKIDVEGHELKALQGMHRPVPYLSFEVNLPEFRQEGIECVRCLENIASTGLFNYTADCREGMALKDWVTAQDCSMILAECHSSSIEVFWKTAQ